MNEIMEWLVTAEEPCQLAKVKWLMKDIIGIVLFAGLVNASEWIEIYHIISAVDNIGFYLDEAFVSDKSNEITAIPELLQSLNIKGHY